MSDLSASEISRLERFLSAHDTRFTLALVRMPQGTIRDELAAILSEFARAHHRTFQRLEPRQQTAVEIWRELESAVPPGGITMLDGLDAAFVRQDADLASLLNRQRERIAELLPGPVLLTLSEGVMNRFLVDAPDLADWYAASFEFESAATAQELTSADTKIPERSGEWIESRISLLENQLKENLRPRTRANALRELGDLYLSSVFGLPLPGQAATRTSQESVRAAEAALRETLEIQRSLVGPDSQQDLYRAIESLGYFLAMMGRYDEAEPLCEEALAIARNTKGPAHSDTLNAMHNLAAVRGDQGRHDEAESLFKELLATCEKVLGREHPETLAEAESLANLYLNQGRLTDAERLLLRSSSANQHRLGAEHPTSLSSANSLAILYGKAGRYAEAQPIFKQTLSARERLLGPEHPETLSSFNNLANLYERQGRYAEAESLFQRAANGAAKVLGPDHPKTVAYRGNLEKLRKKMGTA